MSVTLFSYDLHVSQYPNANWCWAACLSTAYAWEHGKADTSTMPPCKVANTARALSTNPLAWDSDCCAEGAMCDLSRSDEEVVAIAEDTTLGLEAGLTGIHKGRFLRKLLHSGRSALITKRSDDGSVGHLLYVTGYIKSVFGKPFFLVHDPAEDHAFFCTGKYLKDEDFHAPWVGTTWLRKP